MFNRSFYIFKTVILGVLFSFPLISTSQTNLSPEDFGRLPDVSMLNLSPDGKKLASLVRIRSKDSKLNGTALVVKKISEQRPRVLLNTSNERSVIEWLRWAGNDSLLLGVSYPSKIYGSNVSATRLLKIDAESGESVNAIPKRLLKEYQPVIQDNVVDFLDESPDELLVMLRLSDDIGSEVYRINHSQGTRKRVQTFREKALDWQTDRQNKLRIARSLKEAKTTYKHRRVGSKKWEKLFEFENLTKDAKTPLGFGENPNKLYYTAIHNGRDAVFLADLSVEPINSELILASDNYDVSAELIYSSKRKKVVGLKHNLENGVEFWDDQFLNIQAKIDEALPNTNNQILDFSDDEGSILFLASNDTNAGVYYLLDRRIDKIYSLAYRYEALASGLMSEKQPISYKARDGIDIKGFLTTPKQNLGKPSPTIIFPHGGPISYSSSDFDYWTQYFASKGLNVLQMNFRGSSGYGYDFMAQGLQDWGGKMQTDVEDGTRWLIEKELADPNRICVVGASYGGYAALMEVSNNPDLYKCAVSFAGVTDLNALLVHYRKYINYEVVKKQIGSDRKTLNQNSPIKRVEAINTPVFIAHGTKDFSVPFSQSKKLVRKLRRQKRYIQFLELEGGDHYLSNENHRVEFFLKMDQFLSSHLGL